MRAACLLLLWWKCRWSLLFSNGHNWPAHSPQSTDTHRCQMSCRWAQMRLQIDDLDPQIAKSSHHLLRQRIVLVLPFWNEFLRLGRVVRRITLRRFTHTTLLFHRALPAPCMNFLRTIWISFRPFYHRLRTNWCPLTLYNFIGPFFSQNFLQIYRNVCHHIWVYRRLQNEHLNHILTCF